MKYFIEYFIASIDIDECTDNVDACNHKCVNTIGSYICTCEDGYKLDDTETTFLGKSQQPFMHRVNIA